MQKVCLDTSMIVDFLRGKEEVKILFEKIKKGDIQPHLSSITLFELYFGAFLSKKPKEAIEDIKSISSWMETIPIENETAYIGAIILAKLKNKGVLIEIRDVLIAASAVSKNLPLVTKNKKHFEKIPGLELYSF